MPTRSLYQTTLFLKQGYYDYMYVTVDKEDLKEKPALSDNRGKLMGNRKRIHDTRYYRLLTGRVDELIGMTKT